MRTVVVAGLLSHYCFCCYSLNASEVGDWQRILLLHDYNTRMVVIGVSLLGLAAGLVGVYAVLRGRALLGDTVSHAAYQV